MRTDVEVIPYGEISARLTKNRWPVTSQHYRVSRYWERATHLPRHVFVTFSHDLDDSFVEMFRKRATQHTRLLILNERYSTDRLLSRIVDLQIRTSQRFCVIDAKCGAGKTYGAFMHSLLKRLTSALEADDKQERILDAKIENGILHVVSPDFNRVDVPLAEIPDLEKLDPFKSQEFEIDEDGSFIYWPKADVHLGWAQLQQLANPAAALKAAQKHQKFNKRYGKAVQEVRQQTGLKLSDIEGISEKQLRRIEKGDSRLTSNAIEALAQAHKLAPNDYMKKLAESLD